MPDLVTCMQEFEYLPFEPALPTLCTLQSAMPASDKLVAEFNSASAAGEETLTSLLRERVFSKNTSLQAFVPLSKRLTFVQEPGAKKPGEELTAAQMGRTALKAVINLVEISQCVDLPQLLEHRVVEECMTLLNSDGIYRKTQKSKLIQKLSLQYIDLQEPYIAVVDMDMIWSMAAPTAEDQQTEDGTPYNWSDYVHKVSFIILPRHGDADRIICVNDPYDAAYDDERDLRVQGKAHVPNTYVNLADPSPVPERSKRCRVSNNGQLQKLICNYLTDLAQMVWMLRISTQLAPTSPMGQHSNQCRTAALTSLRLTLSSSPFSQFCASQAALAMSSLMPLIQMPMLWQQSSGRSWQV